MASSSVARAAAGSPTAKLRPCQPEHQIRIMRVQAGQDPTVDAAASWKRLWRNSSSA